MGGRASSHRARARWGFQLYAGVLVVLAAVGWWLERTPSTVPAPSAWRAAEDYQTWATVAGPEPQGVVGAAQGQALYYGPLTAGDCLPPFDLTRMRPSFNFHGFGARLDLGRDGPEGFTVVRSVTQMPETLPPQVTHLQVCFPAGIEHEQVLVLGGAALGMIQPPLRRLPQRLDLPITTAMRGLVNAHGATIFALAGAEIQVAVDGPSPVVVELGDFGKDWRFEVKETLRVAAGEHRRLEPLGRWAYARVLLPEGQSVGYLVRAAAGS